MNQNDVLAVEPPARLEFDRSRIAGLFSRRPNASFVVREIAARMHERLDLMRLDPERVLDAGSGAGLDLEVLSSRYPKALVLGVDLASQPSAGPKSLRQSLTTWFGSAKKVLPVGADISSLPLTGASVDLIWSNCVLHWLANAESAIAEWSRVLKPGAGMLFSCFGPDTLKQVRSAFEMVDMMPHTLAFTDLHDYGDMLASLGFAQPVMDAEALTLTYDTAAAFWSDVRSLGGNPLIERRRGLLSRAAGQRLDQALDAQRNAEGKLELSFEIIYGHGWRATPRARSDKLAVISMPKSSR